MMMHQHIVGLHTSKAMKKMTLDYRGRARTLWTKEERIQYTDEYVRNLRPKRDSTDLQELIDELTNGLSARINKQMGLQLSHDSLQKDSLARTILEAEKQGLLRRQRHVCNLTSIQSSKSLGTLMVLADDMKQWRFPQEECPSDSTEPATRWPDHNIPLFQDSKLERLHSVRSSLL
jgi:hypothetical protein